MTIQWAQMTSEGKTKTEPYHRESSRKSKHYCITTLGSSCSPNKHTAAPHGSSQPRLAYGTVQATHN